MFPDSPIGADATVVINRNNLGTLFMAFDDYGFGTSWVPSYETLPLVGHPIDFLPPVAGGVVPPPEQNARGLTRPARLSPDAGAHEWASELEDEDMDLLSDWWELSQGLNPSVANDTSVDCDGNGEDFLSKFQWRTDPNDPASFFTIDLNMMPTSADITLNTQIGYPYRLESCTDAVSWLPVRSFTGEGPLQIVSEPWTGDRRFWRVRFDW